MTFSPWIDRTLIFALCYTQICYATSHYGIKTFLKISSQAGLTQ